MARDIYGAARCGANELEINGERYLLAGGNKTDLVAPGAPETDAIEWHLGDEASGLR